MRDSDEITEQIVDTALRLHTGLGPGWLLCVVAVFTFLANAVAEDPAADLSASPGLRVEQPTDSRVLPILTVERSDAGKAYLAWGGKPLLAYGPGDEMRLLSGGADVVRWARWQSANGMNLVRGHPASVPIDAYGSPGLHPFNRKGDKWNVDDWNGTYFDNMSDAIGILEDHGIFLHLQLWQIVWFKEAPNRWAINYLNPANNVNEWTRGYAQGRHYLTAPAGSPGHAHRKQWVRRILNAVKGHRNVWIDVINELGGVPGTDLDWAREVVSWIREWEKDNDGRLLVGVDSESVYHSGAFKPYKNDYDVIMFNELRNRTLAIKAIDAFEMPAVSVRSSDGTNQWRDYMFANADQVGPSHQSRYRRLCYRSIFAGLQAIGAYWKPEVAQADYLDMRDWPASARALRAFWGRIGPHWPELAVDDTMVSGAVAPHAYGLKSDRLYCVYLECGSHTHDNAYPASTVRIKCPFELERLHAEVFNPRTGESTTTRTSRIGTALDVSLPAFTDDSVVLIWRERKAG
ncbi:MAG: hypothetical protein JXA69_21055 [Phycisphaerae bacterium]|nr:hypothetical protein [Phycisphaerae bacterium]